MSRYLVDWSPTDIEIVTSDILIIGSGIAGLFAAFIGRAHGKVTILTKKKIEDSNTDLAQGGIAAAIDEDDSPFLHLEDTLKAGDGLCNVDAVEVLVTEGPERVEELIRLGARFDQVGGEIVLTREAAHGRARILHASDATGEEIRRTLVEQCLRTEGIAIHEDCFVVDLVTIGGRCLGALVWDCRRNRLTGFAAPVTIVATGGAGQLYRNTTNPAVATGDGIAAAFRAGAQLMDMEFVQFHPTALNLPGAPHFLISEAVRGEGGILRNQQGDRFMPGYHPMAELAPRDIVSRAIWKEMGRTGSDMVYLDLTQFDPGRLVKRFPKITATCAAYGVDVTRDLIPVSPAAHYMMGGIRTDLWGRTNIEGLYACGEAACNGVHGANRLASNSLLDGLVFGGRIADNFQEVLVPQSLVLSWRELQTGFRLKHTGSMSAAGKLVAVQETMWDLVGILRNSEGLKSAGAKLGRLSSTYDISGPLPEAVEAANLLTLGNLTTLAASIRTESRGGHFRTDYPERDDRDWRQQIILTLSGGKTHVFYKPLAG